ncbi:MAG: hypothetical protein PHR25_06805 [Clostridia bacterium]|nr:hypothetical protein [Clostridia bacterium]
MYKKINYELKDYKERTKKLGNDFVDVFFFKEELSKVECCLCILLKQKLDCDVYWYKTADEAIVCVPKEKVSDAIKYGKQLIIQNFDTMSTEYLEGGNIIPVLHEYTTIAIFQTENIYGLWSWCHNIDEEIIVKTSKLANNQCILTKNPFENIEKLKTAYSQYPFGIAIYFML